jgi:hypothetical protein
VNAGDSISPLNPLTPANRDANALPAGAIEKLRAEGHELIPFLRSLGAAKPAAAPGRPAATVVSEGPRSAVT